MPHKAENADGRTWLDGKPICPLAAETLSAIGRTLDLTDREMQIIRGLLDGKREDAIADELGISHHTVHAHLGRVYRKLNVDCCTGLVLRVFREYVAIDARASCSVATAQAKSPPSLRIGSTF